MTRDDGFQSEFCLGLSARSRLTCITVPEHKALVARSHISLAFRHVALHSAIHDNIVCVCVISMMFGFPTVQVAYLDDKLIEGQNNEQDFRIFILPTRNAIILLRFFGRVN